MSSSVSFWREDRYVELECFSTSEVIEYLALKLNINKLRFKISAEPLFCNVVMVKFDDVNFIIYAEATWIQLSFEQENAEKMYPVIEEITKWDKFSTTEKTFYVEIDHNNSRTIMFENGYATCEQYRIRLGDSIKITSFKNDNNIKNSSGIKKREEPIRSIDFFKAYLELRKSKDSTDLKNF